MTLRLNILLLVNQWKKTAYDDKITDIKEKISILLITINLQININIKTKKMVNESNIFNLIKDSDFNTKIATSVTKAELKAEQDKIVSLQTHDLSYYLVDLLWWWWFSEYVCLSTNSWHVRVKKKGQGTDYILSRKSKGVYTSKLKSMYTDILHSIKLSGWRMKIKFEKDSLAVEKTIMRPKL